MKNMKTRSVAMNPEAVNQLVEAICVSELPKGKECNIKVEVAILSPDIDEARTKKFSVYVSPRTEMARSSDLEEIKHFISSAKKSGARIRFTNLYGKVMSISKYTYDRLVSASKINTFLRSVITDDATGVEKCLMSAYDIDANAVSQGVINVFWHCK